MEEQEFDIFIFDNFVQFSGEENVIEWLNDTEAKFTTMKIARRLRFQAIPLLVKK